MQEIQPPDDYDLRDEYDLTQLQIVARGRYAASQRAGTNLRVLDPDVVEAFPTDEAVNSALRLVLQIARIPRADAR
ncbi:MAG TPA: hypothetical protein VLA19_25625 [Herpetosiphonaceae bacterium]|nr:hypothetical protein [Herpetosiphonaceae bacterium]